MSDTVDADTAAEVLAILETAYPRFEAQLSAERRELYISRWMGLDAAALFRVTRQWIDEKAFPPAVAELRQAALKLAEQRRLLARVKGGELEGAAAPRPGEDALTAGGVLAGDLVRDLRDQFAHTFFRYAEMVQFDPLARKLILGHSRPQLLDWWEHAPIKAQIIQTAQLLSGEPIAIEWASDG